MSQHLRSISRGDLPFVYISVFQVKYQNEHKSRPELTRPQPRSCSCVLPLIHCLSSQELGDKVLPGRSLTFSLTEVILQEHNAGLSCRRLLKRGGRGEETGRGRILGKKGVAEVSNLNAVLLHPSPSSDLSMTTQAGSSWIHTAVILTCSCHFVRLKSTHNQMWILQITPL